MKRGDYIICRECGGTGKAYDHTLCLGTFGLGYLFGKEKCPRCNGKGYIRID